MSLHPNIKNNLEIYKEDIADKLRCIIDELEGKYPHYGYVSEKLERIRAELDCIEGQANLICVDTKKGSA